MKVRGNHCSFCSAQKKKKSKLGNQSRSTGTFNYGREVGDLCDEIFKGVASYFISLKVLQFFIILLTCSLAISIKR